MFLRGLDHHFLNLLWHARSEYSSESFCCFLSSLWEISDHFSAVHSCLCLPCWKTYGPFQREFLSANLETRISCFNLGLSVGNSSIFFKGSATQPYHGDIYEIWYNRIAQNLCSVLLHVIVTLLFSFSEKTNASFWVILIPHYEWEHPKTWK